MRPHVFPYVHSLSPDVWNNYCIITQYVFVWAEQFGQMMNFYSLSVASPAVGIIFQH